MNASPVGGGGGGGGILVQEDSFQTGTYASGTTTIPADKSKPQNTEGNDFMTLEYTPTNANNRLEIEIEASQAASAVGYFTGALFKDEDADAIACIMHAVNASGRPFPIIFPHIMVAGTTDPITFEYRGGLNNTGTAHFNGDNGGSLLDGVLISSIRIKEYEV